MKVRKTNKEQIKSQLKNVETELKDGVFIFSGPLTIQEFAMKIKKPANEIITLFFMQGNMYNINHILNEEQIAELCFQYEFDFQKENQISASNFMEEIDVHDEAADLSTRPPIITVMGHVDHGKTTLIDKIRNANVTDSEAGGITQHTGAYQVVHDGKKITFLDTPGHEAFTSMRARGAKLTDIVVLVVAADDGVMPQTKEAIDHAKSAGVPIIVFVNKMDKQGADAERVKSDLSGHDVLADDWGGDVQFVYGSGLTGEGIDALFAAINLQAELLELTANPNRMAIGTVVEARVDSGRGTIATIIVENGTLKVRDFIVAGSEYGRVRTMHNSQGEKATEILPGSPVTITGLNYSPQAGDKFFAFVDEKFAKKLAEEKKQGDKEDELKSRVQLKVEDGVRVLNIVVKSDVQGTAEAVKHSLAKVENDEAKVNIVRASVGSITKSDVLLAKASNSIIYAFNLPIPSEIISLAKQEEVEIKTYNIIYKMIEEVQEKLKGFMAPKFEEVITGRSQIIKVIPASKIGNIAGCIQESGFISRKSKIRLFRDGNLLLEGELDSLQRGPDQAKKVESGKDFGCHIRKFNDIKEGDFIESFELKEVKV